MIIVIARPITNKERKRKSFYLETLKTTNMMVDGNVAT
jgi:hypothetical protein